MSEKNKNIISKIWEWCAREVHGGNMLPFILAGLLWFFILLPMYNIVRDEISALFSVGEYVVTNQDEMKERMDNLEKKVAQNMSKRKAGKIGITYH